MPPTIAHDDYFLELVVEAGLVSTDRVAEFTSATAPAATDGLSVYRRLLALGEIDERQANAVLASRLGLKPIELSDVTIASEVLSLLPREQALHHELMPLRRHDGVLEVAVVDPLDTKGTDALAHRLQLVVEPWLAGREDLRQAMARHYGPPLGEVDEAWANERPIEVHEPERTVAAENTETDAPVIQLVHEIIARAVARRASDIHLEPLARSLRIRYRIDGVLLKAESPSKRLQAAVVSRVKIMAGISIAEKRLPQDGRIRITLDGRALDLRVSTLPTAHGESVVMRILAQETLRIGFDELGFMPDDQAAFDRLIVQPDGILLVTGPTGSGKTTTLYSCLHALNQSDRKIITVEDPVEYQLSGVNQVPVRAETGMTFAAALRAMLRQAPNVVMVGEIRDYETAEIAIHAALTGHLVFSTLHTNDAPGAITRLIDIGVKPFLVASSLRGVLAQRLVRKVCAQCARPVTPTARELDLLGLAPDLARPAHFRRGVGCPACQHTGYLGRMGIFELLVLDDTMRHLIHVGASAAKLRQHARGAGMRGLREDGVRKVIAGLTTIEEVVSITIGDSR